MRRKRITGKKMDYMEFVNTSIHESAHMAAAMQVGLTVGYAEIDYKSFEGLEALSGGMSRSPKELSNKMFSPLWQG